MPGVRSQSQFTLTIAGMLIYISRLTGNGLIRILDINSRLLIYVTSITKLTFLKENSIHNIPEMKFGHVTLDHRRQKITVACIVPISSSEACFEKILFFSPKSKSIRLFLFLRQPADLFFWVPVNCLLVQHVLESR